MMKQEYITKVAEAFRKGEFRSISGPGSVKADYEEAYLDERTDYDFEHMYIHLLADEREGDFIEVLSVELDDEPIDNQFEATPKFSVFFTTAMEIKLWHLRMKFDPEREYEIAGTYEEFSRSHALIAFYVKKLPGAR
ncbi:MAG: hypothetical protein IKS99_06385 [Firmicutes bacterium]|nr:hypothetical protein [Bacillota bacterium]